MHPSYFLNSPAGLLMIGVIKDQTYIIWFMAGTQIYPVPKLDGHMPDGFPSVNRRIFHKAAEDILPRLDQRIKCAILLIAASVFDAEAREKKKALKYSQQPVYAVTLACDGKCVALGHFDLRENRTYVLHSSCHIRILKKVFDIRQKRSNFMYRHGFELVFLVVLKITHFLVIRQETMSFLRPYLRRLILAKLKLVILTINQTYEQDKSQISHTYYRAIISTRRIEFHPPNSVWFTNYRRAPNMVVFLEQLHWCVSLFCNDCCYHSYTQTK